MELLGHIVILCLICTISHSDCTLLHRLQTFGIILISLCLFYTSCPQPYSIEDNLSPRSVSLSKQKVPRRSRGSKMHGCLGRCISEQHKHSTRSIPSLQAYMLPLALPNLWEKASPHWSMLFSWAGPRVPL